MNPYFLAHSAEYSPFLSVQSSNAKLHADYCEESGMEIIDTIADPSPSLEDQHFSLQVNANIREFVAGLSPNLRSITVRHYWFGHSQAEIAAAMGVSRSAISHALARVRKLGMGKLTPLWG